MGAYDRLDPTTSSQARYNSGIGHDSGRTGGDLFIGCLFLVLLISGIVYHFNTYSTSVEPLIEYIYSVDMYSSDGKLINSWSAKDEYNQLNRRTMKNIIKFRCLESGETITVSGHFVITKHAMELNK